jgi:di/tricarboxylate transporter
MKKSLALNNESINCLASLILIVLVIFVSVTNNKNVRRVGNQITSGTVNTILILLIIALVLTEDLQMGFVLSLIYLVILVRFNEYAENFKSGPSPLSCDTYKNNKEKTGGTFYPLNE